MSRISQANKRPISERISIFEKQTTSSTSSSNSPSSSGGVSVISSSSSVQKTVISRTFTGKNFDAIKSQFDGGITTPPSSPPEGHSSAKIKSQFETIASSSHALPPSTQTDVANLSPVSPPQQQKQINERASLAATSPVPPGNAKTSPSSRQSLHQPLTRTTSSKKSPTAPIIHSTYSAGRKPTTTLAVARTPNRSATSPIQKLANPPQRQSSIVTLGSDKPISGETTPEKSSSKHVTASNKSQTSPIHTSKMSAMNVNTITISVNKEFESDFNAGVVCIPAGSKSTTLTKVIKDKSSTAPIVHVTVEAPQSSKAASTMFIREEETFQQKVFDDDVTVHNIKNNGNLNGSPMKMSVNAPEDINSSTERRTYWTNQALLNDNSQKIKEAMKLDLEYKDEKPNIDNKDLEHFGATTDEDASNIKRQRPDLEMRIKDQEEELDDLAAQVQMLEQAKAKLEMEIASMKKDHRREVSAKEDELEDARTAAHKKVKALEQQLETEHEERLHFAREKHDLETKIMNLQGMTLRSTDEEQVSKLKKDLKRLRALLKDSQAMIERLTSEGSNKVVLRQLKNQLEDAEFGRTAAIKAKQNAEMELSDVQQQLDDVLRSKSDSEDKLFKLARERADLSSHLVDNEEQLQDIMKKYKACVAQLSVNQITISEQANNISDLEEERNRLKENLAEFAQKIQSMEGDNVSSVQHSRLEMKIKEMETKLELEQTTRSRMETQLSRLKECIDKLNYDCNQLRGKEAAANELVRKLQRQLKDAKEGFANLQQKETEVNGKKNELEKQLELAEAETVTARNDLKLAMKRIEDLQNAINGELDSETDSFNSGNESDTSEEGMNSFLDNHRRASSAKRERLSISKASISRPLEPMAEEAEVKYFSEHHYGIGKINNGTISQQIQGLYDDDDESQA